MISLDNYEIEQTVLTTRFQCDIQRCKGACCTFAGGSGAPVLPEESARLHDALAVVWNSLPEQHRAVIRAYGILEHDGGDLHLRCVNDRACVFVAWEHDVAVCSIQRAYERGAIDWPKPQSCHLFPIRLQGEGRRRLVFERFSECRGVADGADAASRLVDFLEPAITRVFGAAFSDELRRLPAGGDARSGGGARSGAGKERA
jgi:hypothetical protein